MKNSNDTYNEADTLGIIFKENEFILDFAKTVPRISRADKSKKVESIHTTISANPERVKRFTQILQKNVEKYEDKYGEIELEEENTEEETEDPGQDYIG